MSQDEKMTRLKMLSRKASFPLQRFLLLQAMYYHQVHRALGTLSYGVLRFGFEQRKNGNTFHIKAEPAASS